MKQNKRIVNRYYSAILYEEDKKYKEYLENIKKLYKEVTYIVHDRDIKEDGTLKKRHTHILFKVGENARHIKSIAKEIGIEENYLQGCNKKAMLTYLIHLYDTDKTQYNIEEVQGELKPELKKILLKKEPEENKIQNILINIKQGSVTNIYELLEYAIKNQCLEEIKKSQYLLCKLIDENRRFR